MSVYAGGGAVSHDFQDPPKQPPPERLRARPRFLHVQNTGARFKGRLLTLLVAPTPEAGVAKVGFTVSRKVGPAVVRNRVRRRLREIVRLDAAAFLPSAEHVIIAYPAARRATYGMLQQEILCLLRRAQAWASRSSRPVRSSRCTAAL